MRTYGHRAGIITYWGLLVRARGGIVLGRGWRGTMWGEMPGIDDRGMDAANHLARYVPMQQSYMICTCTPESKVQFKNK